MLRLLLGIVGTVTSQMSEEEINKMWDANGSGAADPQYASEDGAALNDAARKVVEMNDYVRKMHSAASSRAAVPAPPPPAAAAAAAASAAAAATLTPVSIHAKGKFKYVLIDVSGGAAKQHLVRSIADVMYHADVYETTVRKELTPRGLRGSVLGGGRLVHDPARKTLNVFGYSMTFGRCEKCNQETAHMLEQAYPDYKVTWSNDGY